MKICKLYTQDRTDKMGCFLFFLRFISSCTSFFLAGNLILITTATLSVKDITFFFLNQIYFISLSRFVLEFFLFKVWELLWNTVYIVYANFIIVFDKPNGNFLYSLLHLLRLNQVLPPLRRGRKAPYQPHHRAPSLKKWKVKKKKC